MTVSDRFTLTLVKGLMSAAMIAIASHAIATPIGAPMVLKDEGMFFVNGELILSNFPSAGGANGAAPAPATFAVNQMFVHYRIPYNPFGASKLPIVMVHGAGLTGMSWETTPDGREGWGTYFVRKGYPDYVVDFPGRGRSGFNVTPLNQAKFETNFALQPSLGRTGAEAAWVGFRFGPVYGTPYPGVAFPLGSMAQFSAQGVPNAEVTLTGGGNANVPAAIAALLDKIGPSILMVHSQAGGFADAAVALRPNLVKMMIHVESNCPALSAAQVAAYAAVPSTLYVHGDFVVGNPTGTGQPRLTLCTAAMNAINSGGGHATLVQLPQVGIFGSTHMLMQDYNNLETADWLVEQIHARGL